MAEHQLAKLCSLVNVFAVNNGNIVATIDYLAIGSRPTPTNRILLYLFISLSAVAAILGLINVIARLLKGSLWLFRFVHSPDGAYVSPHAGVTFSIASIVSAAGCIMLGVYVINLWNGNVVHGLVLVDTIIWLPLWIGAFCIVWGTAIATLSMNRNRRSIKCGPTPPGRYFIPPLLFNILVVVFPTTVVVTLLVIFNLAQKHGEDAVAALENILGQLGGIADSRGGVPMLNCTFEPTELIGMIQPGQQLQASERQLWKWVRVGFSVYAGTVFLLLVIWVPFFVAQYDILRQQIRRGTRARRRQQRIRQLQRKRSVALSQDTLNDQADLERGGGGEDHLTQLPNRPVRLAPSDSSSAVRFTGRTVRHLVLKSDASDASDHTGNMRGAYRALLGTSFVFAIMVLTFLGICLWIIVNPAVIASGNGSTSVLLVALGCFGVFGSSVNGFNCYRAIVSPAHQPVSVPGSPSSRRRFDAPLSPRLIKSPPLSPSSVEGKPSLSMTSDSGHTDSIKAPMTTTSISEPSSNHEVVQDVYSRPWGFPIRPRIDSNMTSGTSRSAFSEDFHEPNHEAERGCYHYQSSHAKVPSPRLESPPTLRALPQTYSPAIMPSRLYSSSNTSSRVYSPGVQDSFLDNPLDA